MLDALEDHPFLGITVILLIVNPISMFVYNLFNPAGAARFVQNNLNDFWCNSYTKLALKWPLKWSKHWVTLDNIKTYDIRKQVVYYLDIDMRPEVLKAMSSEAQVRLVHKHFEDRMGSITGAMRLTDDMFDEWLRQIVKKGRKFGYSQRLYEPLSDYLKIGKLPYRQVNSLAQMAVDNYESSDTLMEMFKDYIERFGVGKDDLNKFAQYMCDKLQWSDTFGEEPVTELAKEFKKQDKFNHFFNILNERQINYEQRVFTKSQRGVKQTDEWLKFCEKTSYICVAAQKEMGLDQYHVFHATGHTLSKEAIFTLLSYPDRNLHRMVFQYEPMEIFWEHDLHNFIDENVQLKAEFDLS